MSLDQNQLLSECDFSFSRSSGPGGQNVNKVNSRVELRFNIYQSEALSPFQKETLLKNLATKLTLDGDLILTSQESRSQLQNRELVVKRFLDLITEGMKVRKKRRPTRPTRSSQLKRLENKKRLGEKKQMRKKL